MGGVATEVSGPGANVLSTGFGVEELSARDG
jgi:hypothetical protein